MARTKLSKRGIIFIALSIVVLVGLTLVGVFTFNKVSSNSPIDLTLEFMNNYKNATSKVMNEVKYPFDDELSDTQFNTYKDLIRSQYKSMTYEIVGEVDAIIKVDFAVYDYASSYDKANSYLSLYEKDKTLDEKVNYKLKEMANTKEKVTYSIEFKYYKLDDVWYMTDFNASNYQKLAGTF